MYLYEILLIITAALWGLSFPAAKYIGTDVDSVSFLAIRFTIAAFLLLFAFRKHMKSVCLKMALPSVGVGALLAFHSYIQLEGLRYTSSGNSAFITSTNIIFVPVFAFLLFRKKPDKGFFLGLLAVVTGFLLISGIVTLSPLSLHITTVNYGDFLTLLCAILTALYFVLFNALTEKYSDIPVNVLHMFGAAGFMWVFWLFTPEKSIDLSNSLTVIWILYCAVFASAAGFMLLSKAQTNLSAAKVSVICSLESVFALLFAAVIPGRGGIVEPITPTAAIGGLLILLGVLKISVKPIYTHNQSLSEQEY